jgi:hypothetical protein
MHQAAQGQLGKGAEHHRMRLRGVKVQAVEEVGLEEWDWRAYTFLQSPQSRCNH